METEVAPSAVENDPPIDDMSFVRIGPFKDTLEANLAKNRLHAEGIAARIANETLDTTLGPIYAAAYGGTFLLVPREDAEAAHQIIADVETTRRERTDAESPICPFCTKRPSEKVLNSNDVFAAITLLTFKLFFVDRNPTWKCRSCGHRFNAPHPRKLNASEDLSDEPTDV